MPAFEMLGDSRNELYLRSSPVGNNSNQIELDVEFRAAGVYLKNLHENKFKLMGRLGFGGLVASEASIAWLLYYGVSLMPRGRMGRALGLRVGIPYPPSGTPGGLAFLMRGVYYKP